MLDDAWELRMERAALQGAVTNTRTLDLFVQEMVENAKQELDATEAEISANENIARQGSYSEDITSA